MNSPKALNSLTGFTEFTDELLAFSSLGIRPGLERMSRLLAALGSPEKKFKAVQVLGTNGKGSTSSILESIFRAAGLRTAVYTSPHLVSLGERLLLNGSMLPVAKWRSAFAELKAAMKSDEYFSQNMQERPTFFENLTALCFLMISREGVDIAILEAGMGGRYDATSSCEPVATMITPIGMDHMEYLGEELRQIASEKFAAIRSSVPAFYAGDDKALTKQFFEECKNKDTKGYSLDAEASLCDIECDLNGTSFTYESRGYINSFNIPLVGIHQAHNASRAISAVRILRESVSIFENIADCDIASGISSVRWPGRFEVISGWSGARALVLDGAHNEHGMAALVQTVKSMIAGHAFSGVSSVVYATMKDKDITPMLLELKKLDVPVFCTAIPMDRATPAEELFEIVKNLGLKTEGFFANPLDALGEAGKSATCNEIVICCGSLYFIGFIKSKIDDEQRL